MEDSLSIIFAMIVALVLIFFVPLLDTWELQDNLSYAVTYAAVTDFVDTVRNTGEITANNYANFMQTLNATGNTFDVTMEHRAFVEDMGVYLNTYTNTILETIDSYNSNGEHNTYYLDKYDYFYVTVKNTNMTQATVINQFFSAQNSTFKIGSSYGGIVWSVRDGNATKEF